MGFSPKRFDLTPNLENIYPLWEFRRGALGLELSLSGKWCGCARIRPTLRRTTSQSLEREILDQKS